MYNSEGVSILWLKYILLTSFFIGLTDHLSETLDYNLDSEQMNDMMRS